MRPSLPDRRELGHYGTPHPAPAESFLRRPTHRPGRVPGNRKRSPVPGQYLHRCPGDKQEAVRGREREPSSRRPDNRWHRSTRAGWRRPKNFRLHSVRWPWLPARLPPEPPGNRPAEADPFDRGRRNGSYQLQAFRRPPRGRRPRRGLPVPETRRHRSLHSRGGRSNRNRNPNGARSGSADQLS